MTSASRRRVVVSGPGTGKSTVFRDAFERAGNSGLAITFLGSLADDLATGLPDGVLAKTFHGYCLHLLYRFGEDKPTIYPDLYKIIARDLRKMGAANVGALTIRNAFADLDDSGGLISQSLALGDCYGAVSFDDFVYRVLNRLLAEPERVPPYPLVVVDEYQDFNRLETAFIDVLATKSPVLIAGDDDQALYSFKKATPAFLRALAADAESDVHRLPFCQRCPDVVVRTVNDIISHAVANGNLVGRLAKPFACFLPIKGPDSRKYPEIIHAVVARQEKTSNAMGEYVADQIRAISPDDIAASNAPGRSYPTALVIGLPPFIDHVAALLRREFPHAAVRVTWPRDEVDAIDGFRFLSSDPDSRLGWRILLERLLLRHR